MYWYFPIYRKIIDIDLGLLGIMSIFEKLLTHLLL